ncbi:anthranilate synthase family protein [Streptomyces sp. NBC_01268]|uniref:anthranilate synthase family protein n=1 Tax=Streptomyces sp. NBC_01268 TaxID=2903806 RepID=UPI002E35CA2C|nr:chorismate-binding protein [Streptomyces sp. NBC_01268]
MTDALEPLLGPGPRPPAYALLHRPGAGPPDVLDVLVGRVSLPATLAGIPLPEGPDRARGACHESLVVVPYRQITERGFACVDDGAPLIAMTVTGQGTVPVGEALARLPREATVLTGARFDLDDEAYARTVGRVVREAIGEGAGADFVLRRTFLAELAEPGPDSALAFFRRLLEQESGAYWTFLVHTGARTFVGASPERHVSLRGGTAVMNPISGTYRHPPEGPSLPGVMEFLADRKERDELSMVVDEELKMMARICEGGGRVVGPYLKEMARLAHTEYLIEGRTDREVREILRETLFAPTVTGSPLENACRVIARYEGGGRGYYSGVVALIGRDASGGRELDSAILIRTADIDAAGRVAIGVGATVVRHSDPDAEAAETRAKTAGLLAALEGDGPGPFGTHPEVRAALARRNADLSGFWLGRGDGEAGGPDGAGRGDGTGGSGRAGPARPAGPAAVDGAAGLAGADGSAARAGHAGHSGGTGLAGPAGRPGPDGLAGHTVLVVDAEDTFTEMIAHQLRALGLVVTVRRHDEEFAPDAYDLVVLGPGPGDPGEAGHPRIEAIRTTARGLLAGRHPFLAVCLSHQVVSLELGLPLVRRDVPHQGVQKEIDLFGRRERVGFYNSFAARGPADRTVVDGVGAVELSRDPETGEVHALRGPHFTTLQFHPESVLTRDGPGIFARAARRALRPPAPRRSRL